MARTAEQPTLSLGNHIYLYALLSRELGCGKQTFVTRVEEALAAERLGAEDLGFESTRALLEALDSFIKLTVFKGGRLYATVIAQPAWDTALAAPADVKANAAAKGGKPWKRKKGDKALKPVKPRRVKREAAKPTDAQAEETASVAPAEPDAPDASIHPEAAREPQQLAAEEAPAQAAEAIPARMVDQEAESLERAEEPGIDGAGADTAPEPAPAAADPESTTPQPTISLTVTFDPYSGAEGERTLEASSETLTAALSNRDGSQPAPIDILDTSGADTATATDAADATDADQAAVSPRQSDIASTGGSETHAEREPAPPATPAADQAPMASSENPLSASPAESAPRSPAAQSAPSPAQPQAPGARPSAAATPVSTPTETAAAASAAPAAVASAPSPEALAGYPTDFIHEVYCPAAMHAELSRLLPLGTGTALLLAEDFQRALDLGLVSGTRSRATFPLRIEHADAPAPIAITIRKQSGPGLPWAISHVE